MTDNIVERLRDAFGDCHCGKAPLLEAAAEIERLRDELRYERKARRALELEPMTKRDYVVDLLQQVERSKEQPIDPTTCREVIAEALRWRDGWRGAADEIVRLRAEIDGIIGMCLGDVGIGKIHAKARRALVPKL